jgi:hypothetical protein
VVESEPDLTDALDFDAALSAEAEQLALGGSTESVDVRRAMAVGEIARQQLARDLRAAGGGAGKPRQVVLYVHLSEAALCGNRDTEVIVKPVVDLNEHIRVKRLPVPTRPPWHRRRQLGTTTAET